MFGVRFYEPKDYDMICDWWLSWDWDCFPEAFLPKTGIIITYNDIDVCAGFIYETDSLVAWGENYILNKEAPREARKECIQRLIDAMCTEAKSKGFKVMMSSVENKSLISKLESKGFQVGDTNMVNLVKAL